MLFCSYQYLFFFSLVFTLYWLMPWPRLRVWLLLVASFYFYASWNKWLAILIFVSTAADYGLARWMVATPSPRLKKGLLIFSLTSNLGMLTYFKYANFFLESLEKSINAVGGSVSFPLLSVILPVGISFYTFEAINYMVDVYRGKTQAERNLANFMVFITFFPHLVAGPIVRAHDFLPQTHRPKRWDWLRLKLGIDYFMMGLVKKVVIADQMARYADPVFGSPHEYSSSAIWMGVIAYALQVYCDFSGYTDMAIGSAHMLGYKLAQNFNMPYLSRNITEYWRRWHISLSTWLRDYLFIPLVSRTSGSNWEINRSLLITMTLGGLWHGASWTFVVWGIYHGSLLIVHRTFQNFAERVPGLPEALHTTGGNIIRWVLTCIAICGGWVLFRAQTLEAAGAMMAAMAIPRGGLDLPLELAPLLWTIVAVAACHAFAASGAWKATAGQLPAPAWGFGYSAALTLALGMSVATGPAKAFIYFQF